MSRLAQMAERLLGCSGEAQPANRAMPWSSTQGVRVFRMAPLHHHFELGGTHETRVTSLFWAASVLCGAASVALAAGTRLS